MSDSSVRAFASFAHHCYCNNLGERNRNCTFGHAFSWEVVEKTLLFMGRTIEKVPLCVKEKGITTYCGHLLK
jgi:hypothetical protein